MAAEDATSVLRMAGWPVVELRRYALHPGARETLIELFDRELVEAQEAVGMRVLGQFRDLDDPDSFVWLRGFSDMESRKRALAAFYGGPVWKEHARAANATMVDSDNVLLLRPVTSLALDASIRPPPGTSGSRPGLLVVTIYHLTESTAADFRELFRRELEPAVRRAGVTVRGTYASEHGANTYPALPVREGEDVFVWLSMFADEAEHAVHADGIPEPRAQYLERPTEILRLRPTARSLIHG